MPPKAKKREDKEIGALKTRRRKAQDKNDIIEEAKLCNAIGCIYMTKGDYEHALQYHQEELALSEASNDRLGTAIAHRKVGECLCELGDYERAVHHQIKHLEIAQETADLAEQQRALATLGRTYFVQSLSVDVGNEEAKELRLHAGNANLKSLDVCDKLGGVVPDRELLEMRSRLYLNLGLVYQNNGDLHSARKFMEKALSIVKELCDAPLVLQCHLDIGSLYLQETKPALALRCFREALSVASEQRSWQQEAEVLREMSQAQLLMSNFHEAKSCLKKAVKLLKENSQVAETETDQRKLNTVRKVIHYSLEMEALGINEMEEKIKMCEKLGDLCCSMKAYPAAIKYYEQQLSLSEAHGMETKDLSPVFVSLARTYNDCCQYSKALVYYQRELELRRGNPCEECDTWSSIAAVRENADMESGMIMEAYGEAYKCASESSNPKLKVDVCKAVLQYCKSQKDLAQDVSRWEKELECALEQHPNATLYDSGEDSDSQNVEQECGFETPESLSEMETGDEEDEEDRMITAQTVSTRGVTARKKSKLLRRNEKGETLLHLAAISGNLSAARQLVLQGADINARDNCGWIPLHEACNHGHIDLVSYLLDNGADINDPGGVHCGGVSPLIDAAISGHVDIVHLLVQRGADLFHKDTKGRIVTEVLTERMAETNDSYELENEHTTIRDYLWEEMRQRGWEGGVEIINRQTTPRPRISESSGFSLSGTVGTSKQTNRRHMFADRTGRDVLLSSDDEEDDDNLTTVPKPANLPKEKAPFSIYKTGSSAKHTTNRTSTSSSTSASSSRQLKRPLLQDERPALIPEGRADSPGTGAFPIIDHWLEDDVGGPLPKKRKAKDPFKAVTQNSKGSLSLKSRRSGSQTRLTYSSMSRNQKRDHVASKDTYNVDLNGSDACEILCVDSPPDRSSSHHQQQYIGSSTVQFMTPQNTTAPPATPLPLRIRVKIENKSYLIPCPAKLVDGSDSTIHWLAQRAAERYYTQHGVKPHLSLTTIDNALLSTDDVITHVLQSGEEVIGVVEQWHLPPLPQRYQTACSNKAVECHEKVLKLFQDTPDSSVLDFSHIALRPMNIPPLLTSLQGHSSLTSLNLCGSRLDVEAVTQLATSISRHPNINTLDLSCTGLNAQCLDVLSKPSPPPSTSYHSSSHSLPWSALKELHLGFNPLGCGSGSALSSLLRHTLSLEKLYLQSCGLNELILDKDTGLESSLNGLSSLTHIVISRNPLQSSGIIKLFHCIPTSLLSHLDLDNTCTQQPTLEHPTVAQFFDKVSYRLQVLRWSYCTLDVHTLCKLLEKCLDLHELHLAAIGLSLDTLHPLCRFIQDHSSLGLLNVSGNDQLGNDGCLKILQSCSQTVKLILSSCGISSPLSDDLVTIFTELVSKNKVDVIGNNIDSSDCALISSRYVVPDISV